MNKRIKLSEDFTLKEKVNLEVFTITEAQQYVEEKTGIKETSFFQTVRKELTPHPLAVNHKKGKYSKIAILKIEVDYVISRMKDRLIEASQVPREKLLEFYRSREGTGD